MVNSDTVAEVISNVLLFLLVFGMSATVDIIQVKNCLQQKYAIASGIAMQFIIMPFVGYLSVMSLTELANLNSAVGITLLIVTSSPGGSYSNWWCSLFNADLALSVTLTAINTLLSTVLLPMNLMLYTRAAYGSLKGSEESVMHYVNWKNLFISLGVVALAILAGLAASYKYPHAKFRRWANRFGSLSGMALIIFTFVLSNVNHDGDSINLWSLSWPFYVGVIFPCITGLLISLVFGHLSRLPRPQRVSLSVETCYQNVGIAASAAVSMFDDPYDRAQALCVPLFYGFVEAVLLCLFCLVAWKKGWTKAPKEENLCVVLVNTYELPDSDSDDDNEDHTLPKNEKSGVESICTSPLSQDALHEDDLKAQLQSIGTYCYRVLTPFFFLRNKRLSLYPYNKRKEEELNDNDDYPCKKLDCHKTITMETTNCNAKRIPSPKSEDISMLSP